MGFSKNASKDNENHTQNAALLEFLAFAIALPRPTFYPWSVGKSCHTISILPNWKFTDAYTFTQGSYFFLEYFIQFAPIATTKNLMSQLASTLLFVYLEIGKLGVARSVLRFFRLNREILYVAGKLTKLN